MQQSEVTKLRSCAGSRDGGVGFTGAICTIGKHLFRLSQIKSEEIHVQPLNLCSRCSLVLKLKNSSFEVSNLFIRSTYGPKYHSLYSVDMVCVSEKRSHGNSC